MCSRKLCEQTICVMTSCSIPEHPSRPFVDQSYVNMQVARWSEEPLNGFEGVICKMVCWTRYHMPDSPDDCFSMKLQSQTLLVLPV